jgi:hypothetical protein
MVRSTDETDETGFCQFCQLARGSTPAILSGGFVGFVG